MIAAFTKHIRRELFALEEGNLYKAERVITLPQCANCTIAGGPKMLTGPGLGVQFDVHAVAEI